MRFKISSAAILIAALAVGATTSSATLHSDTSVQVTLKEAGAPATVKLSLDNSDNAVVPQPISSITIASSSAKWTSSAVAQCKSKIPTNADGDNGGGEITPACPKPSKVGSGKFTVNTGTEGQPIPSDLGTITGDVNIYNYKPGGGQQAALLLEIMSDTPVPNAHQYSLATVSKSGAIVATIPKMDELPPSVKNILSPPSAPRIVSLVNFQTTIKSPAPKKGKKPFLTLKNFKKIDFHVTLQR